MLTLFLTFALASPISFSNPLLCLNIFSTKYQLYKEAERVIGSESGTYSTTEAQTLARVLQEVVDAKPDSVVQIYNLFQDNHAYNATIANLLLLKFNTRFDIVLDRKIYKDQVGLFEMLQVNPNVRVRVADTEPFVMMAHNSSTITRALFIKEADRTKPGRFTIAEAKSTATVEKGSQLFNRIFNQSNDIAVSSWTNTTSRMTWLNRQTNFVFFQNGVHTTSPGIEAYQAFISALKERPL